MKGQIKGRQPFTDGWLWGIRWDKAWTSTVNGSERRRSKGRWEGESGFVSTDVDVTIRTLVSYLNPGLLISGLCLSDRNINFHLL